MLRRWTAYRLRMRTRRKEYMTTLRKALQTQRIKMMKQLKKKVFRGAFYGLTLGTAYYFGNGFYSEYHEMKQIKKKFLQTYPQLTKVILLSDETFDIDSIEQQQKEKLQILRIEEDNEQKQRIVNKLGSTIIVFSPENFDQLCNAIGQCHRYRHKAMVGNYKLEKKDLLDQLQKVGTPSKNNKFLMINLQNYKKIAIDKVNDILNIETGCLGKQINHYLQENGYQPLVDEYAKQCSIYDVISNNLPLKNSSSLSENVVNLSLVSAEGKPFKSSTQTHNFGQIVNLTPLFVGSGGSMAIPAQIKIRVNKKNQSPSFSYSVQNKDINQLILEMRNMTAKPTLYRIQGDQYISFNKEQESSHFKKVSQPKIKNVNIIFSINNSIFEEFLLNKLQNQKHSYSYSYQKGLLYLQSKQANPQNLILFLGGLGGVLVWTKDHHLYNSIKPSIDCTEVGAELMKKIVQVREGLDKKHTFQSHERYQKYFAKGFFRRITQVFW